MQVEPMTTLSDRHAGSLLQRLRIPLLRALFVLLLAPILFIRSAWTDIPAMASLLRIAGVFLVFAAVLGRFWAILYIGGRKNLSVMCDGPYSISRHPLYLASTIGATGLGLLLQSVTLAILIGGVTFAVLLATARQEERNLRGIFGPAYDDYSRVTPRLLPAPHLFHTPSEVMFRPAHLRVNFADALVFLGFIPLAEIISVLHVHGWLAGPILP
ncbi:methyltransferase family protein [Haematobacter missouriensis]|nr:isoprenylcysteine carboxylmethyltransferase family protein [Haematobacter missouriensis]